MEQKEMNIKFVKMAFLAIVVLVALIICGYGGAALWGESKVLSVLAYTAMPVVLYFGIARGIKINND